MRTLLACLTVLLISSPIPVFAEYDVYTAGWLRDQCAEKELTQHRLYCAIYIRGVSEGNYAGRVDALGRMGKLKNVPTFDALQSSKYSAYCVPSGVNMYQLGEMFVKYMNEQPEKLHEPAYIQFGLMLEKHFPCKSN